MITGIYLDMMFQHFELCRYILKLFVNFILQAVPSFGEMLAKRLFVAFVTDDFYLYVLKIEVAFPLCFSAVDNDFFNLRFSRYTVFCQKFCFIQDTHVFKVKNQLAGDLISGL